MAEREAGFAERERVLAERERERAEQALSRAGDHSFAAERLELERRQKQMLELEESLRDRARRQDEREADAQHERISFESEKDFRDEQLDRREQELDALERKLNEKESELAAYVSQVQGELHRRERHAFDPA